ncbi:hypothetical protein C8J57DRAFT_1469155 [Mycena rebaudengoi]|nr:hypothetical protein C8J57DRAFT_1469155 [Mycena rebaudengoi]
MATSNLPQELTDAIVERVEDSNSLKACSLVASTFVGPCQRSLFRCTLLNSNRLEVLNAMFTSPRLASYIRDVELTIADSRHDQSALTPLLRSLLNVAWLKIHGGTVDLIVQPSLRRLHLLFIYGVQSAFILREASSVVVLSLWCITIEVEEAKFAVAQPSFLEAPLKHLFIVYSSETEARVCELLLNNPAYTASLERLRTQTDALGAPYAPRLFAAGSATLRHLELDHLGYTILALRRMLHVHTVALNLAMTHPCCLPPYLHHTLTQLAALPNLEVITLHCTIWPWQTGSIPVDPPLVIHHRTQFPHRAQHKPGHPGSRSTEFLRLNGGVHSRLHGRHPTLHF